MEVGNSGAGVICVTAARQWPADESAKAQIIPSSRFIMTARSLSAGGVGGREIRVGAPRKGAFQFFKRWDTEDGVRLQY